MATMSSQPEWFALSVPESPELPHAGSVAVPLQAPTSSPVSSPLKKVSEPQVARPTARQSPSLTHFL